MQPYQATDLSFIILRNSRGMEVVLSAYGARIVSIWVPDKSGRPVDVVLGFLNQAAYQQAFERYHGATIGRFANRIAGGRFAIAGQEYYIQPNNGGNALHGGEEGFHTRMWQQGTMQQDCAEFHYLSEDGEGGFPGNVAVTVTYVLTPDNELQISFKASTDKATLINLTNHAFFNLNGEANESVLNHELQIRADHFLPVDHFQIPTGEARPVAGTPFDFREPKRIGADILQPEEQLLAGQGFDHNYILNPGSAYPHQVAASVWSPVTGIRLEVFTTEPGMQLYTGNFLNGKDIGKSGKPYKKHGAFCLEAQHYPDSPNQPSFPPVMLLPGDPFRSQTIFKFSVNV